MAGTFTLSLTATNIAGTSPVKQLTLTVSDAVYVDFAAGLDTNPGSAAQPVKTLAQGIGLASVLTPKRTVRVSTAAHALTATLELADGVSLRGGYVPGATWTLSGTRTPVTVVPGGPGNQIAIRSYRVNLPTVLNGFDVTAPAPLPASAGASSIGVSVESSAGLTITNCRITAANGTAGTAGMALSRATTSTTTGSGLSSLTTQAAATSPTTPPSAASALKCTTQRLRAPAFLHHPSARMATGHRRSSRSPARRRSPRHG